MANPTALLTSTRLTQSIYYGRPSVGTIPITRTINTTAPITGGGNLSADLTLALTTTPANDTTAVGWNRALTTTLPLQVNAGTSATLHNDVAFTINTFSSSTSGIVSASGGGTTNFLCANGSWLPVAGGAGVPLTRLINTTAPLAGGGDLSADRTLSVSVVNITTNGVAPATGGTDPTKFLCMTNPVSWVKAPGAGSFVTLQASSPGTADVGNAHVTGIIIADSELVAGDATGSFGQGESLYVNMGTPAWQPVVASWFSGTVPNPGFRFVSGRGTRGSPVALNSGDQILQLYLNPYSGGGNYNNHSIVEGYTDGSLSSGAYPISLKLRAVGGNSGTESFIRMKGSNGYAGVDTDSPASAWEIGKSYGKKGTTITAAGPTTLDDTSTSAFFLDCTSNTVTIKMPPPSGRAGRQYTFTKVDSTANVALLEGNASELIGGHSVAYLWATGMSLTVRCDGTNWWITHAYKPKIQSTQLANSSTLSNSAVNTKLYSAFTLNNDLPGAVFGLRALGIYSNTGTPTLDFQIQNSGTGVIADSGAVTTPSSVTNAIFQIDCEWVTRTSGAVIRPTKGVLSLANSSGAISAYNMALASPPVINSTLDTLNLFAQWGTPSSSNSLTLIELETYSDFASIIS